MESKQRGDSFGSSLSISLGNLKPNARLVVEFFNGKKKTIMSDHIQQSWPLVELKD